jgi:hypothetical protein
MPKGKEPTPEEKREAAEKFASMIDRAEGLLDKATGGKPLDLSIFPKLKVELEEIKKSVKHTEQIVVALAEVLLEKEEVQ